VPTRTVKPPSELRIVALGALIALAAAVTVARGQTPSRPNLDFSLGSLDGWEGSGFYLSGHPLTPGASFGACSSDAGSPTRKGMLRYVVTVPAGAELLVGKAFAATRPGIDADGRLDVVLAGADQKIVPKKVRGAAGWSPAPQLLPRWQGKPREYAWDISHLAGETLQIVLIDQDDRPGHYIYAAGFHFTQSPQVVQATAPEDRDFEQVMMDLQAKHQLTSVARYDSKRFTALSNADASFTVERLQNCELFYDLFLDHFRRHGFAVHAPRQRLMVAVFDSQAGFEAYLGQKMPATVVGVYDLPTNRLVLFDLNSHPSLQAQKKAILQKGAKMGSSASRSLFAGTVERKFSDLLKDANLSTTMHEVAHQISFNCGLLRRESDKPYWLIEGLACYCEATDQGDWTTLGGPNPLRIEDLARGKNKLVPLVKLVQSDDWRMGSSALVAYAQSWALFRLLMEEKTPELKRYLHTVATRKTPDHRRADFGEAFGADLPAFERRYQNYLQELLTRYPPQKAR
jgi:Protein of unknown function (DUF1570)